jgi:hypothetical protein
MRKTSFKANYKKVTQYGGHIAAKTLNSSYRHTLQQAQEELRPINRSFSKFIHLEAIDRISSLIGSFIARPGAILLGSIFAFVITLIIYFIAKNFGYILSGFESIGAFIIGWLLGNIFDYFRLVIIGKES